MSSNRLENLLNFDHETTKTPSAKRNLQDSTNRKQTLNVLIENTPTPFLLKKFNKKSIFISELENIENLEQLNDLNECANKNNNPSKQFTRRIIPNTPVVNNTISKVNQANNSKKVKINFVLKEKKQSFLKELIDNFIY